MSEMCASCAFRKACPTWHEARNRAVSQICAAGPLVFFCHSGMPWRDTLAHLVPARMLAQMAGGQLKVCEGWKRAVAARQWSGDPALRSYQRWLANIALLTAERFIAGQASVRELQQDLGPLAEFYRGPRAWQIARMVGKVSHGPADHGGEVCAPLGARTL